MRWRGRWLGIPALAVSSLFYAAAATPQEAWRPQDFRTTATFQLVVEASSVLRPGPSTIVAKSVLATPMRDLKLANLAGLEILFSTEPITDASRSDVLERQARELRKRNHAIVVLLLDGQGKISQVNLTYVIPGTTVVRTVAWKPEDLARFSSYSMDGKRVLLKSKGLYRETSGESLTLSWDVDVNVPVLDPVKP